MGQPSWARLDLNFWVALAGRGDGQSRPSTRQRGRRLRRSDSGDTPSIPRVLQELRSQGQDVGNDVHALLTTIQGYWVFISEEEHSGR